MECGTRRFITDCIRFTITRSLSGAGVVVTGKKRVGKMVGKGTVSSLGASLGELAPAALLCGMAELLEHRVDLRAELVGALRRSLALLMRALVARSLGAD